MRFIELQPSVGYLAPATLNKIVEEQLALRLQPRALQCTFRACQERGLLVIGIAAARHRRARVRSLSTADRSPQKPGGGGAARAGGRGLLRRTDRRC